MPSNIKLNPHPRLYLGKKEHEHLRSQPHDALTKAACDILISAADRYTRQTDFGELSNGHNAHLIRARGMQTRVVTLLTAWLRTDKARYRDAAVKCIQTIGDWEYWSWITWRVKDARPEAIFDLSYGENSATLAIAYDTLHHTLSDPERKMFLAIAKERSFKSFLKHTRKGPGRVWYVGHPETNWNTVCTGGAGMLALAMYEDLPEARKVLPLTEESFVPFMKTLDKIDGGWPEGIGYWNYGMRYAFMYLLSWQRATGKRHPLLKSKAVKKSLGFPIDLTPNGVPCSFGDVNRWAPAPFHFAIAQDLGCDDIIQALQNHLERTGLASDQNRPNLAEFLMLRPMPVAKKKAAKSGGRLHRIYKGLDWGVLADAMPEPKMYLSVRGGTTEVPHGHLDLLSFHCVVGDEAMISSIGPSAYLDTTFSSRRWDIPELNATNKNTIFINGVGIANPARVSIKSIKQGKNDGFFLNATDAMGDMRDGKVCDYVARVFLNLNNRAFLIVDRVDLPQFGLVESRMHSYADVTHRKNGASIKGKKNRMGVAYASNVDAKLHTAVTAPTQPGQSANMLRWVTDALNHHVVSVTLMVPGELSPKVTLETKGKRMLITAKGKSWSSQVTLTEKLKLTTG